jgi:hypothetical protein
MASFRLRISIAIGLAMTAHGQADGGVFMDGNKLQKTCRSTDMDAASTVNVLTGFDAGVCLGYISGVGDSFTPEARTCWPEPLKAGQAISIVRKYLQDHPEQLHIEGVTLVSTALQEAFPNNCQRQ